MSDHHAMMRDLRRSNAPVSSYGKGPNIGDSLGAQVDGVNLNAEQLEALRQTGQPIYNQPAFGMYQRDTDAHEKLRDYYETLEAVAAAGAETRNQAGGDANFIPVDRTAPISDYEQQVVREEKKTLETKKWSQYWASQMHPARPWTVTEVAKVAPEIMERKLAALKEVSQFALDKATLLHMGHGGNERLATLQYMIDQGLMDHMPQTVLIDNTTPYQPGPLNIWQLYDPNGLSSSTGDNQRWKDKGVVMARQGLHHKDVADRAMIPAAPGQEAYGLLGGIRRAAAPAAAEGG